MTTKQLIKAFLWTIACIVATNLITISIFLYNSVTARGWITSLAIGIIFMALSTVAFLTLLYDSDKP